MTVPLTSEDLHRIGTLVEKWNELLIDNKTGDYTEAAEGLGKIEVSVPDTTERLGYLVLDDGWVGFEFDPAK